VLKSLILLHNFPRIVDFQSQSTTEFSKKKKIRRARENGALPFHRIPFCKCQKSNFAKMELGDLVKKVMVRVRKCDSAKQNRTGENIIARMQLVRSELTVVMAQVAHVSDKLTSIQ